MIAVRWYLRYGLSYRDVEELLAERGIVVDPSSLVHTARDDLARPDLDSSSPGQHGAVALERFVPSWAGRAECGKRAVGAGGGKCRCPVPGQGVVEVAWFCEFGTGWDNPALPRPGLTVRSYSAGQRPFKPVRTLSQ